MVTAWTVVMRPSSIPHLSLRTLEIGARQLVVQEALETTVLVVLMVDTDDKDWAVILWWGGEDNLFGATLDVKITFFLSKENTGGLANVVSSSGSPSDFSWIGFVEDLNELSVNSDTSISLLDLMWESSMDGVVLEEIDEIVKRHEWIIDGHNVGFVGVVHEGTSEDKSTDSSESVDTHSNLAHFCF
jgi:hypothetical protein